MSQSTFSYKSRLLHAVTREDKQALVTLLEEAGKKKDVDKKLFGSYKFDACCKAIAIKNLEYVKLLLPIESIIDDGKLNEEMNICLIEACIKANFEEGFQYLLSSGLAIELPDRGWSALIYAVMNKKQRMINDLLQHSANPNLQNSLGETALMKAIKNCLLPIVKCLVVNGADVNLADKNGNSALLYAVEHRDKEILAFMLKNKANVNHQDKTGKTALMAAVNTDILKLLLEHKATLSLRDKSGRTALMHHSKWSHVDMVTILLNTDCNGVNAQEESGKTALMFAIESMAVDNVRVLLQHGSDPNICDNSGKSPLILATTRLEREIVELLLDSNADINHVDNDGYSAFQYVLTDVRNRKWINVLKLLLIRGGSLHLDKRMENGKTLIQYALERNVADISWYLIIENCVIGDLNIYDVVFTLRDSDILEFCISLYLSGRHKREMIRILESSKSLTGFYEYNKELNSNNNKFHGFCQSMDLKSHCRRKIRECVGAGIQQKITKLALPTSLTDFILLKDIIPEDHFSLSINDRDDYELRYDSPSPDRISSYSEESVSLYELYNNSDKYYCPYAENGAFDHECDSDSDYY